MKTKLFALALAASMSAGVAFAQTPAPTQDGGSEATPEAAQRGTPELPGEEVISNFYTDNTMKTMRSPEEIQTYWGGLTPEEQEAVRSGCSNEFVALQKDLPESTLNVCKHVNSM